MAVLGSAPLSPSTSRLGMPTDQVQPSPCPRLLLTIAHTSGPADPHGKTESALFLKHRAELLASLSLIPCSACGVQNFLLISSSSCVSPHTRPCPSCPLS